LKVHSLVWAAALIVPALVPALARADPPLADGGVAGWFCDGAANRAPLPIDVFRTFANSPTDRESLDKGGPDACLAFLDSSAYVFAVAGAGEARADARDDRVVGRCCHGAREKFRLAVVDPIFWDSAAVPEPPTYAILAVGFAAVGLASCSRTIGRRDARRDPLKNRRTARFSSVSAGKAIRYRL
jgi:hypothetical protein